MHCTATSTTTTDATVDRDASSVSARPAVKGFRNRLSGSEMILKTKQRTAGKRLRDVSKFNQKLLARMLCGQSSLRLHHNPYRPRYCRSMSSMTFTD